MVLPEQKWIKEEFSSYEKRIKSLEFQVSELLQLLQSRVVGRSEQLTYKCDYCQDDGVMITGLDCTCDAAPNKS